MIGGFEGGLSALTPKTFAASRAHVNIADPGRRCRDMTARARYPDLQQWLRRQRGRVLGGNASTGNIKPSSGIADAVLMTGCSGCGCWTDESDAEGLTDFYGQQRRAARELFIAGEVFFRIRPRRPEDGLSCRRSQMLPAEMLPLEPQPGTPTTVTASAKASSRPHRSACLPLPAPPPGDITDPGLAGKPCGACRVRTAHR